MIRFRDIYGPRIKSDMNEPLSQIHILSNEIDQTLRSNNRIIVHFISYSSGMFFPLFFKLKTTDIEYQQLL